MVDDNLVIYTKTGYAMAIANLKGNWYYITSSEIESDPNSQELHNYFEKQVVENSAYNQRTNEGYRFKNLFLSANQVEIDYGQYGDNKVGILKDNVLTLEERKVLADKLRAEADSKRNAEKAQDQLIAELKKASAPAKPKKRIVKK